MRELAVAVSVESKKFFRSRVPFITMLAMLMIPFVGGLFMYILKDPDHAQKMGIISAKAQLAGSADWPSYFGLIAQAISIGGLMAFGFVMSWIFGREFSDRTMKDLLALPILREYIVISKFIVVFVWCLLLSMIVFVLALVVGHQVDIPGYSSELLKQETLVFFVCSVLTLLISAPVGFFATIGKGYLSPLGYVIFTMIIAQIIAATGYGQYVPWSIPALASGMDGSGEMAIEPISYVIVFITGLAGLMATAFWWRYADQN
ncbi:ABC transporter permease [Heyndrickxia sp. MSNUG]|uniref:ABC transporter permease n=1 Tax=Heyndrickxia sp. MSNUG TaxID=3136677 RepID=UPI003C2E26C9